MKKNIKFIAACLVIVATVFSTEIIAQEKKASPPKVAMATVGGNDIKINYNSPSKKGREIYGSLVPFEKVWRTGANEATTIELSKDGSIGGKTIKAGKYSLFTIPSEKEWTIIINSDAKQWGAYKYKESNDVVRFTALVETLDISAESFNISISDAGFISLVWDKTNIKFEVK